MKIFNKTFNSFTKNCFNNMKTLTKNLFKQIVLFLVISSSHVFSQSTWNTNGNVGNANTFIGTSNNYDFLFKTNLIERLRIKANGNVGIGVTNPTQKLDVNGNLRIRGNVYVDQNVFQSGEFAADSMDAGLINAEDISALKISADSLKAIIIKMEDNSKFIGTGRFDNDLLVKQKMLIGEGYQDPNQNLEKFEVREGNAKIGGDAIIGGTIKLNSMANSDFNFLSVNQAGDVVSQNSNAIRDNVWKPDPTMECTGQSGSGFQQSLSARWFSGNTHTYSCWPVNIGSNALTEYPLNVVGNINTTGGTFLINGAPIRQSVWDEIGNVGIKYTLGNVGIGVDNPSEKLEVGGNIKTSGYASVSKLFVNGMPPQPFGSEFEVWGHSVFHGNITNEGTTTSKRIKVCSDGWCDYVFEKEYKLMPLKEVESFIKENKHLPDVPSANEVASDYVDVFEMQKIQMKKIEELTLYMIELKKENEELKSQIIKRQ